jgi:ABC-type polysaccharide/polyol phosphate export permease
MPGTSTGFTLDSRPQPLRVLAADLWASRQLILVLGRRNFFTRYRRASFGMAWAVGLPLVQATVMAVVFHYAVRIHVPHYPVFVFTGLFAWTFFSSSLMSGSSAIVDNSGLCSRIYFPRAVMPIVAVTANIYNFVVTIGILLIVSAVFQVWPGGHTLLLVPAALLAIALSVTFSLVLSAVQVYFRDVKYIVQAALTAWFYLTPVFYPLSFLREHNVPDLLRWIVLLNPATGVVELFRKAIYGADQEWLAAVGVTLGWVVVLFALAVWLHHRFDRLFTDLL